MPDNSKTTQDIVINTIVLLFGILWGWKAKEHYIEENNKNG